jgi:uncharacterized protein (DUF58 family)
MTRFTSPRAAGYAALAALGLVGALALRRPELAAVAAPFALLVALGLVMEREPELSVELALDTDRAMEGDVVEATVALATEAPVARVEVALVVPAGLVALGDSAFALRLERRGRRVVTVRLRCDRWGAYVVRDVRVRARDALGLAAWERRIVQPHPLKVFPASERLRQLVQPRDTQAFAGSELARAKGEGIEFADLRPFRPGDRRRAINWRASARRRELIVNERRPERNADVVLLVDSFAEARTGGSGTLDLGVRATAALAAHYLDRRDRVGLVTLGGILRWLAPGGGRVQRYQLVDALLQTEIELTYAWRDVTVIPPRVLPPRSLVVALTPLLDDRIVQVLLDLRGRGQDLAVLEVSPVPFVRAGEQALDLAAYRLWLLRRDEIRGRLARAGVGAVRWGPDDPVGVAIEEVRSFRRSALLARR